LKARIRSAVPVNHQCFLKAKERFAPFMNNIRYYHQLPSELDFVPREEAPKGQNCINEDVRKLAYGRYVTEQKEAGKSLSNTLFINADGDEIPPAIWDPTLQILQYE